MVALRGLSIFLLILLSIDKIYCISNCTFYNCRDCIGSGDCVWCSKDDLDIKDRCKAVGTLKPDHTKNMLIDKSIWCEARYIQSPKSSEKTIKDAPFKANDGVVQLKPQVIELDLAPKQPVKFKLSYKPASDYPLDIYMLMDTSYTMWFYVKELKEQAKRLQRELKEYTNNVRLGLGSFIEKPMYPYYNKFESDRESYTFKSRVLLTSQADEFTAAIDAIMFGGNNDDQEAGLDALMQVMTCERELLWRNKTTTRRIIVLCTDNSYHSAGDGKMLGIIRPNDMQCHLEGLNNNLTHTTDTKQDYPSVSQINRVATDGNYIVIFVAKKNVETVYTALANEITGAKYAELKEKESNVVEIIKEAYREAIGNVKFRVVNLPPNVTIKFDPDCDTDKSKRCTSTPEDPIVNINGIITLDHCPPDGETVKEVKVRPIGLNDELTIKLRLKCSCGCEKDFEPRSPKCSTAGSYRCGTCECDENRFGDDCGCDNIKSEAEIYEKCKANKNDFQPCSGRGFCRCGKCFKCVDGFSGDFCEFDNNGCPGGASCFGHGKCSRGECICNSGWMHPKNGTTMRDCSCPISTEACQTPGSGEICSGNGECICGSCICAESTGHKYYGEYCDGERRCKDLEDYVFCNYNNPQPHCDEQFHYTGYEVHLLNKTEINSLQWSTGRYCTKELGDGKYIVFKYLYRRRTLVLAIQKEPEERPKPPIWTAVLSAIGAILLIGILTLILWKVLVDIHDKREYQKFAKESAAAGFDVSQNPLYEGPATNFENPAYNMCAESDDLQFRRDNCGFSNFAAPTQRLGM